MSIEQINNDIDNFDNINCTRESLEKFIDDLNKLNFDELDSITKQKVLTFIALNKLQQDNGNSNENMEIIKERPSNIKIISKYILTTYFFLAILLVGYFIAFNTETNVNQQLSRMEFYGNIIMVISIVISLFITKRFIEKDFADDGDYVMEEDKKNLVASLFIVNIISFVISLVVLVPLLILFSNFITELSSSGELFITVFINFILSIIIVGISYLFNKGYSVNKSTLFYLIKFLLIIWLLSLLLNGFAGIYSSIVVTLPAYIAGLVASNGVRKKSNIRSVIIVIAMIIVIGFYITIFFNQTRRTECITQGCRWEGIRCNCDIDINRQRQECLADQSRHCVWENDQCICLF